MHKVVSWSCRQSDKKFDRHINRYRLIGKQAKRQTDNFMTKYKENLPDQTPKEWEYLHLSSAQEVQTPDS